MKHDIERMKLWNDKVGNLIEAIGINNFLHTLSDTIKFFIPDASVIVRPSRILCNCHLD